MPKATYPLALTYNELEVAALTPSTWKTLPVVPEICNLEVGDVVPIPALPDDWYIILLLKVVVLFHNGI